MSSDRCDLYEDLSVCHQEIGIGFVMCVFLVIANITVFIGILKTEMDGLYLVPGVENVQDVQVIWGLSDSDFEAALVDAGMNATQNQEGEHDKP